MNRYKRIVRSAVLVASALIFILFCVPPVEVHAEPSDVDFTIDVDTSKEYIAGNIIEAPILIKTQTENGYVEMTMLLKYNQDALSCSSIYEDVNGFTTTVTDDGLNIYYKSPDNSKSPIDTYKLDIKFTVKTGVASGKYKLELDVDTNNVYGYDKNGNKDKGLLTISDANAKELTIIETGDSVTTAADNGDEANFYTGIATTAQDVENGGEKGGCVSAGGVVAFIFGSLVLFVAGVVVGFLLCQKRMNEEGYYMNNTFGRGGISENRPQGVAPDTGGGLLPDSDMAAQGGGLYDDFSSGRDPYADPRQPSFPKNSEEDELGTSYFGRASNQRIGGDSGGARFEEDDPDDGFPAAFRPKTQRNNGNRFGNDMDSILEQNRRQRDDDGYGSFGGDNAGGGYGNGGSGSGFGGGYGGANNSGYGSNGGFSGGNNSGYGSGGNFGGGNDSGYGSSGSFSSGNSGYGNDGSYSSGGGYSSGSGFGGSGYGSYGGGNNDSFGGYGQPDRR